MKWTSTTAATLLGVGLNLLNPNGVTAAEQNLPPLRPPAVPLVAHDPYFSIWSPSDKLTDADTMHWTGKPHRLTSLVLIDTNLFRIMGKEPASVPPLLQTRVEVLPTRTIYAFEGEGVRLTLTFMTPALPEDLEMLARPATYLTWEAQAIDGREHEVHVYFDAAPEIAVNAPGLETSVRYFGVPTRWPEHVKASYLGNVGRLRGIRVGTAEQPVLQKKGDDLRIDWGYLYIAAPDQDVSLVNLPRTAISHLGFGGGGILGKMFSNAAAHLKWWNDWAFVFSLGKTTSEPVSRYLMLAYDDEFSIQYMRKNLRPYWRRNGDDAAALLKKAAADYESLKKRCEQFDAELMADLRKAGGEKYARLAALAYRQCFAAGKFVADANGKPISFCKENHSNGCIGTSDVFYPMAPQFLLFGPTLAKSFLVPFMNYAASERWKFPFAPHDLGTYPHANGQVYGGGERTEENQMPVEESGNLLILMAAIAEMEGNADFAGLWWKQLEQWAEYLKAKGFDPENQLCTDDFAGHLAHNVNLSVKAICGLGSFAKLCELRGDKAKAAEYWKAAREFAQRWVKEAEDGVVARASRPFDDKEKDTSAADSQSKNRTGETPVPLPHFRLAFDKPGTWSQKYNLMWDRILGLNLFPPEVARKEMDFYLKTQNKYGLPLDNRKDYTKLDWITWTATLTQKREDFEPLIDPIYTFLNETPDRSPMTDWYETKTAKKVGFTARPVVGGVFAQLLYDKAVWKKWASRDKTKASNWAPMPKPPQVTAIVPAADRQPATWRYTTTKPGDDWMKPDFDDTLATGSARTPAGESAAVEKNAGKDAGAPGIWKDGQSGFGTRGTPGAAVNTVWNTPEIWLRREVEIPADKLGELALWLHHDEDVKVYVNGVQVFTAIGWTTDYDAQPISNSHRSAFKPGKNLIAVHCRQTGGGQYVDLGFVAVKEQ